MTRRVRFARFLLRAITLSCIALLVLLVFYGIAHADTGDSSEPQSVVSRLADMAIQILVPAVTLFVTLLFRRLVRAVEDKTGLDVPAAQEAMIDRWIEQAINFAAEKSYQRTKSKLDKLRGPEKAELAGAFVLDLVKAQGWHHWTREALLAKIEAKMGAMRANGGVPEIDKP